MRKEFDNKLSQWTARLPFFNLRARLLLLGTLTLLPAFGFVLYSSLMQRQDLAESARGPDRDGVFALWLVVRAALGAAPPLSPPPRNAERLRALGVRLRSLNAPAPLRRALTAATADLASARSGGSAVVLSHLVAPTSECLSRRLADAVAAAARAAKAPKP